MPEKKTLLTPEEECNNDRHRAAESEKKNKLDFYNRHMQTLAEAAIKHKNLLHKLHKKCWLLYRTVVTLLL